MKQRLHFSTEIYKPLDFLYSKIIHSYYKCFFLSSFSTSLLWKKISLEEKGTIQKNDLGSRLRSNTSGLIGLSRKLLEPAPLRTWCMPVMAAAFLLSPVSSAKLQSLTDIYDQVPGMAIPKDRPSTKAIWTNKTRLALPPASAPCEVLSR